MTMMVRDEADIICSVIEHHFRQGVTHAIVTDNGSSDGTWEILQDLARTYPLDLRRDPVHRKQQSELVTRMAREAWTLYSADWVINADADEFWIPVDRSLSLADAFRRLDPSIQSFIVPVRDMTGPPALRGTGLQRLILQDPRSAEELRSIGLFAPSTHNSVHIGSPDVVVAQGNHTVSLASKGSPPAELAIEVLHFPWRSWEQFARKVSNAGRSYMANPDLKPSPNHHGMRDFRRFNSGTLLPHYVARSIDPTAENSLAARTAKVDRTIADTQPSPVLDKTLSSADWTALRELGMAYIALETCERKLEDEPGSEFYRDHAHGLRLRIAYLLDNRVSRRVKRLLVAPHGSTSHAH